MDNQQWTYCVAHGTLLSVMSQPAWEGDLGKMDTGICGNKQTKSASSSLWQLPHRRPYFLGLSHCLNLTYLFSCALANGLPPTSLSQFTQYLLSLIFLSFFFFFWCGPFLKSLLNLLQYRCCFTSWFFGHKACGAQLAREGWNLHALHRKGTSWPLDHQGIPSLAQFYLQIPTSGDAAPHPGCSGRSGTGSPPLSSQTEQCRAHAQAAPWRVFAEWVSESLSPWMREGQKRALTPVPPSPRLTTTGLESRCSSRHTRRPQRVRPEGALTLRPLPASWRHQGCWRSWLQSSRDASEASSCFAPEINTHECLEGPGGPGHREVLEADMASRVSSSRTEGSVSESDVALWALNYPQPPSWDPGRACEEGPLTLQQQLDLSRSTDSWIFITKYGPQRVPFTDVEARTGGSTVKVYVDFSFEGSEAITPALFKAILYSKQEQKKL